MGAPTSGTSSLGRDRYVHVLVGIAVEGLKVLADLCILTRRHVGRAKAGLVSGGALSVRGLQRLRWGRARVWNVGPSWRSCCFGAGDLDDAKVVHDFELVVRMLGGGGGGCWNFLMAHRQQG